MYYLFCEQFYSLLSGRGRIRRIGVCADFVTELVGDRGAANHDFDLITNARIFYRRYHLSLIHI